MKYALAFGCFSLVCAVQSAVASQWLVRLVFASMAVAFAGVGLAYGRVGAAVFLKRSDGRLHPLGYVLFWPYHLLNALGLALFYRLGKENAFDKIAPNVYLGSRLRRKDVERIYALGVGSVLDLTCEFSETKPLREVSAYRCMPLLDTCTPTLEQLRDTVQWLERQTADGPVFVHCTLGHGRSATIVAAYLLHAGKARKHAPSLGH